MKSILLPGMIMLSISACASNDPSQGGFFGGLAGLWKGSYEQRVTDKTASWREDERRYQQELEKGDALDATVREQHGQVADLERQAATLEGDVVTLTDEIEALRAQETVTSDDLVDAEGRLAALTAGIDALKAEQDAERQARALVAKSADGVAILGADDELDDDKMIELRSEIDQIDAALAALKSGRE